MRALITYLLKDFFRSYRYFVPSSFYLIFVVWIYTHVPNPVMPSYATTSIILYLFSSWLAMNFLTSEPNVQQQITLIHSRSKRLYAISRITAIWMITLAFAVFAVVYPLFRGAFDQQVTWLQMTVALYGHLLLALMGIVSASLFHSLFRLKFIYSLGGLLICLVVSIAVGGMEERLPEQMAFILWLLPPAAELMYGLSNFDDLSLANSLLYQGYPFLYLLLYSAFVIRIMNRKMD
jgi:hypothetical protein